MNKKKLVVAGRCPLCFGELRYGNNEHNGDTISYFWKCLNCKETGLEVYTIKFSEHFVDSSDSFFPEGSEIGDNNE